LSVLVLVLPGEDERLILSQKVFFQFQPSDRKGSEDDPTDDVSLKIDAEGYKRLSGSALPKIFSIPGERDQIPPEIIIDHEFSGAADLDKYRPFRLTGALPFSADRSRKNASVIENPNLGGAVIKDIKVSIIINVEAVDSREKISFIALRFAQTKLFFETKNIGRIERRLRIFYDLYAIFCFNPSFPLGLLILSCFGKYKRKKQEDN
jgi:hypothetical protein